MFGVESEALDHAVDDVVDVDVREAVAGEVDGEVVRDAANANIKGEVGTDVGIIEDEELTHAVVHVQAFWIAEEGSVKFKVESVGDFNVAGHLIDDVAEFYICTIVVVADKE